MAIEFDTSEFRRSHGKQPRGFGRWAFSWSHDGQWEFTPRAMSFTDAKAWARENAGDARRIIVGP